ncbi:MAG: molybdate ABC transporter permease subunit [Dehalococcoidia bacterium]|nr:molybdate ABC transporter permease subunit [Dehalococcoidia bacterium]
MAVPRRARTANPLPQLGRIATIVYVLFIGLPLVALIARALGSAGFLQGLTSEMALQALRLSAVTGVISLVFIVVVGTPFAYQLARGRSRVYQVLDSLVELPIVLPPVVVGVALLMAFGRRGLLGPGLEVLGITLPFTSAAVVLAQVAVAGPFYIRAAKLGFQGVPTDLEDISQTLGVSPWRTFWRVTVPMAWPALVGGTALALARALSEFGATIMFAGNFQGRTQTMPLAIMSAMEVNLSSALALSILLLTVSLVILGALGLVARAQGSRR